MKHVRLALVWAAGLMLLLIGPPAWSASPQAEEAMSQPGVSRARIVRLSFVQGEVQIDRNLGQGFEKAIENMPITEGTTLRAGDDGQAEVELESDTVVRLVPRSEVGFPELSGTAAGSKITTIAVNSGTAYFHVRRHAKDQVTLALSGRRIVLDHTAHFRVNVVPEETQLAVFEGQIKLIGEGETATVKKNETATLPSDSSLVQIAKGVPPQPEDAWDNNRTQYRQEYASNSGFGSAYSSYSGWGDMNYYGGWYSLPGYGTLWQPYNASFGWSPFTNGAWCWYPSFGWTWVSGYPWGWLPYRHGTWVFVPGWGWAWQPGFWNAWYTVPHVVDAPAKFAGLQPPSKPPRPGQPTVIFQNNPSLALPTNAQGVQILRGNPLPKGATVVTAPGIVQNPNGPRPRPTMIPPRVSMPGQESSHIGRPSEMPHTSAVPHAGSAPRSEAAPVGHTSEMGPTGTSTGGLGTGISTMGPGMGTSAPSGHEGHGGHGGFGNRGR